MADILTPNQAAQAGVPYQWEQNIGDSTTALITGSEPAVNSRDMIFAASQTIPAWTPLVKDGSGRLIAATDPTVPAIAISITDIVTDGTTNYKGAPVYISGCFNPDVLNWNAAYDTEAEKFNAFVGAPTPTTIDIRRPKTHTV